MSHVEDKQPTTASHVGGISLVTTSHIGQKSPASASHAGDFDMIEKPIHIGRNPNFSCKFFMGYHLTHLCSAIFVIRRAWLFSKIPSTYESSLVSQQSIQSLVDEVVVSMQSSVNPTLLFESDKSTKLDTDSIFG